MTNSVSNVRLLYVLALLAVTTAFTPNHHRTQISRRNIIEGALVGIVGSAVLPTPALADVTNKVASSTSLKSVKRAEKQLSELKKASSDNDFLAVKSFFRTPPFSDVRKNCFTILRGGEEGPKAKELEKVYKAFIASVEKIDGTASLGMRGRSIPPLQLLEEYGVIETTLADFIRVADEAVEIPMQYSD